MIKKLKENFDEYSLKARVYPSFVALLPLFLFFYLVLKNFININAVLSAVSSSVITIILIFLISDIVRNLGKYMEIKIFSNELYFPTTEFLLNKNMHCSKGKREMVCDKIQVDFNFKLSTLEEESSDEMQARHKIKEAVGLIRQKVKDGRLLLQYNIRYGFWRNLIGASLVSQIVCVVSALFFLFSNNFMVSFVFLILFAFYFLIFIFKKQLLQFFGYQYADQLLLEYLK